MYKIKLPKSFKKILTLLILMYALFLPEQLFAQKLEIKIDTAYFLSDFGSIVEKGTMLEVKFSIENKGDSLVNILFPRHISPNTGDSSYGDYWDIGNVFVLLYKDSLRLSEWKVKLESSRQNIPSNIILKKGEIYKRLISGTFDNVVAGKYSLILKYDTKMLPYDIRGLFWQGRIISKIYRFKYTAKK